MRVVKICEHEVVIVSLLAIDVSALSPAFCLVAENLVNGSLVVVGIVIRSREVIPVVFLLRVFVPAARKVEAEPCVDFVRIGDCLVAVFFINLLSLTTLLVVCCCLVIKNWLN